MNNLIKVCKIVNTHGIKGYMKCLSLTDNPERFYDLEYVYIENKKYFIQNIRIQKNLVYIKLKNFDDINHILAFKGKYMEIEEIQTVELSEDEYYWYDLLGMDVFDITGNHLGKITNIYETGSNDVYELNNNNKMLLPAIKSVVRDVDTEKKIMTVELPEGLLE